MSSRFTFGGAIPDFVVAPVAAANLLGTAGVDLYATVATLTVTAWTAEVGGTQLTDLLDGNGSPVTSMTVYNGQIPPFSGPVGVTQMWLDAGGGRGLIRANNAADLIASGAVLGSDSPAWTGMPTLNAVPLNTYISQLIASATGGGTSSAVPGEVTNVSASGGSSSAVVSFTIPSYTGTSPITSYQVTLANTTTVVATGPGSPITVPNLAAGSYAFAVQAISAAGYSAASSPSNSVAVVHPAVPGAPVVTGENTSTAGQATFTWTAPATVGSSPIEGYTVRVDGIVQTATATITPAVPGAPTVGVPNTATAGVATFTWSAPAYAGTSPITSYNVYVDGVLQAPNSGATVPGSPSITGEDVSQPGQAVITWVDNSSNGGSAVSGHNVRIDGVLR